MIDPLPRTTPLKCPRIAIVGCGAAAKEFYLPALKRLAGFSQSTVLVDCDISRARAVAGEFGVEFFSADLLDLPFDVEAAIVTTPHNLHAEQSAFFLKQGIHVFVEKPMALSEDETTSVLRAAEEGNALLMVNNYRRLFPSYRRVREFIKSGELGNVRHIEIHDGTEFAWNSATSFYLRDPKVRGVLLDRGAHTVDVVCWWLGQRPKVIQATFDAFDGIDARMDIRLAWQETTMALSFSRFFRLANTYRIECDRGVIEGRLFDYSRLQVTRNGHTKSIAAAGKSLTHNEYAWALVKNFVSAVNGCQSPVFLASDIAPSIAIIDEAYQMATQYDMPWYRGDPNIAFIKSHNATMQQKTLGKKRVEQA